MTEPRTPRSDDCPHCGKSNWVGRSHPDACRCKLPWGEQQLAASFEGTRVTARGSGLHGPGELTWAEGTRVEVHALVDRRVDLFHFIRGLEFHLRCAQENLAACDARMRGDPTCQSCGFVKCACKR